MLSLGLIFSKFSGQPSLIFEDQQEVSIMVWPPDSTVVGLASRLNSGGPHGAHFRAQQSDCIHSRAEALGPEGLPVRETLQ